MKCVVVIFVPHDEGVVKHAVGPASYVYLLCLFGDSHNFCAVQSSFIIVKNDASFKKITLYPFHSLS